MRSMACFCDSCLQIKEGSCTSSHVVNDWVTTKVSFTRTWRDDPANQRKEPVSSVSSAPVTPLSEDSAPVTPLSEDSAPVTPLSEDPAPDTAAVPDPVCRKTFDPLHNEMAAATSYAGVHRIAVRTAEAVKNFPVAAQPDLYVTAIPQGSIDAVSLPLKPDDAPPHHFPVWVFGHPENFVEMRMRIVAELAINIAHYVSPSYLASGSSTTGATLLEYLMLDVDIPFSKGLTPLEVLQAEIVGVCKPSADFNMWGVYAAANVLKVPVTSVHPDKGEAHKRLLAKRTIWPTQDHADTPCYIMWTSHCDDMTHQWWSANHFVPLLQLHPTEEPAVVDNTTVTEDTLNTAFIEDDSLHFADLQDSFPQLDEFYILTWEDGKEYICQEHRKGRQLREEEEEEAEIIFDIKHTAPQHRQYLEFEGVGFGTPSQRQRQYQQYRVARVTESVFQHRIQRQAAEAESALLVKDKQQARKIKISNALERMVEDLIQESMKRGDFNDLPGQGKPLTYSEHNPFVDTTTHNLNKILVNNGFAPEWIMLQSDIRREVHQARQTLAVIHNKLGKEPRSAHDAKTWRASLNKFKEQISEVNIKINKFNLIVPLLNKQKMPYNAEREVRKVLDSVEDYLPEDQNACQAWDVSVREASPLVSSPQQTVDWAQVWQDIKKVFTSSRDKQS